MPIHFGQQADLVIAITGIVIMNEDEPYHRLYTIGNTNHNCPELMIFCLPRRCDESIDLLQSISRLMQKHKMVFKQQHRYVVDNCAFTLVAMDRYYIAHFAGAALCHYNHAPLQMLQILLNKNDDCYQPVCKMN